jgi:hypothetical protein
LFKGEVSGIKIEVHLKKILAKIHTWY